jgi:hypothetical protein
MDRLDLIGPFLKTALLSQSEQLFKSTANLVKCYPAHEVWTSVFLIRTYSRRNRRIERLTASWIRLNSENKQLRLLSIPVLTPSDEVNLAAYEWISRGGRRYRYMTCILQDVLLNASKDSEVSLLAIEFCRKWLRNHKTHERTGRMHGVLISTTNSTTDVKTALRWYKSHSHLKGAEQVIAALLGLSYRTDFPLATDIIEEAKRLLRNDETRRSFPRLIGSLISVNRDADSILWAKECFKKNRLSWILARLLESAPDEESMAMARDSFSDWKNSANEPMMLRAILVAKPTNKKFRRRAFYWLSKNPKNSWSDSLIKVLSRRIVG